MKESGIDIMNRQILLSLTQRPQFTIKQQVELAVIELKMSGVRLEDHYKGFQPIPKVAEPKFKKHSLYKFNEEQVFQIRECHAKGWPQREIAKVFKCVQSTVSDIVNQVTYQQTA